MKKILFLFILLFFLYHQMIGQKNTVSDINQTVFFFQEGFNAWSRNEYEKAKTSFEMSLQQKEKFQEESTELYKIQFYLGLVYRKLGYLYQAIQMFEKCEQNLYLQFDKQHPYYIYLYDNKAKTYKDLGQYKKAIIYHQKAIKLIGNDNNSNADQLSGMIHNLGIVHFKRKEFNEALNVFAKSIEIRKIYKLPSLSQTIFHLAKIYDYLNEKEKAEKYYKQYLSDRENEYGIEHTETAIAYLNYGIFCKEKINRQQGLAYFNKALYIFKEKLGMQHAHTSSCLTEIGNYYSEENQFENALNYYQKALIAISDGFEDINYYKNPHPESIFLKLEYIKLLKKKASALQQLETNNLHNIESSINCYKEAIKVIEMLRNSYQFEESKQYRTEKEKETYTFLMGALLKLYKQTHNNQFLTEAFQYSEKSKSANLFTALQLNEVLKFGNIPDSLLETEHEIKQKVGHYEKAIYDENKNLKPNDTNIQQWQSMLFDLYKKQENLIKHYEKNYPEYYRMKYDTRLINISDLQNMLKKNEMIIAYTLSDDNIFTFTLSKNKLLCIEQPLDKNFINALNTFIEVINNDQTGSYTKKDYDLFVRSAHIVYQKILAPFKSLIKNKSLIIIPDEQLNLVPFEALLTKLPVSENSSFKKLNYLIKENTVSYAFSASILLNNTKKSLKGKNKILAFAPVYNYSKDSLLPISNTLKEVNHITSFFNGDVLTSDKATENNFKRLASAYNILHLAMHSDLGNDNPLYSSLIFSGNDSIDDNRLHAYEIYNMDLNADLVILSACNTGKGKLQKGEGVMSLSRSFAYAGVNSQMMSLWLSDDKPSSEIIHDFYKYLSKGKKKAKALCQAKLNFLKKASMSEAHPHYWSNLILLGNTQTLSRNNHLYYFIILIVCSFMVITILSFTTKSKK